METYDSHKTTTEVRQADNHQTNKWALILGMIGVVVAFALIYWWFAVYNPGLSINNHY